MRKNYGLRCIWTILANTAAIGFGFWLFDNKPGCFWLALLTGFCAWIMARKTK